MDTGTKLNPVQLDTLYDKLLESNTNIYKLQGINDRQHYGQRDANGFR